MSVYIASSYHGTKSAKYVIRHNGVSDNKWVNQNNYYNQWVSLGTYYFAGGPNEYVYLGDATGEAYATRYVGFDAVKFAPHWRPRDPTASSAAAKRLRHHAGAGLWQCLERQRPCAHQAGLPHRG